MTPTTNLKYILGWIGRVTLVHFITYIVFGIIFFNLLGYATIYASSELAAYMRSTTDPLVMAGPLFQLIRGPIIALALYPFRKIFTDTKQGWALLWGLLLALMIIAPAGAAPGSIEGLIYTKVPLWFHVISLPEVVLQTLVLSWLVITWQKHTKG
ncbi:hypothetical protein KEJ15_01225 [Candidatus Bathyarchaeota archaeon]|nr:hypothetical protein [Candidatus Bathyarchaeota archaeon]